MKIVNPDKVVYTEQAVMNKVVYTEKAVMNLMEELDKLREENIRLKKALQFYSNRRNFDFRSEKELRFCNSDDQEDVFQPFGTKAKEALFLDKGCTKSTEGAFENIIGKICDIEKIPYHKFFRLMRKGLSYLETKVKIKKKLLVMDDYLG